MSNSPTANTGYAVVTAHLAKIFKELGHEVIIFAYYGIERENVIMWNGIPIIPRYRDPWGRDIYQEHYKRCKADILMPIFDIWVTRDIGKHARVVAYSPTDHEPVAPFLLDAFRHCWKIVPFCKWAEKELKKAGLKQVLQYIPHGVDTKIFKPLNKEECRKKWGVKDADFVIGVMAGNYDKEGRKRWDKNMEAIKFFREQNPDCKLKVFFHTDVNEVVHGWDLNAMIKFFGLEDIAYVTDPYYFVTQLKHSEMPTIYNCFDVCLNLSSREGFGLAAIESQACGVPIVQTDFSAMTEHTLPELRVKVKAKIMTPLISWTAIPDSWHASEILTSLWKSPTKLERLSKKALEFAKQFDWNSELVRGRWVKTLSYLESELNKIKKEEKK